MPDVKLDADAAELIEMLQFLSEPLARDPDRFSASLAQFAGHLAYGLHELRVDPRRSPALTGTCPGTLPLSANAAEVEQP